MGRFKCCKHCVDDPPYHEDNAPDTHDIDCDTCTFDKYRAEGWDEGVAAASQEYRATPLVNPYRG